MSEKDNKKSKGWLSKLKDAAFETTEETSDTSETSTKSAVTDSQNAKPFIYSNPSQASSMGGFNGQFDEQFYKSLLKVMEDNNIEGVDYLEFSKSKKAMDGIAGITEAVKFQSTYATLKANDTKLTKEYLISTADVYIKKLDEESKEFDVQMQDEINNEVVLRNSKIEQKNKEIKEKQEKIAALTADINTLSTEISTNQNEANTAQAKIEMTAKNFKVTLDALKGQISMDKQNIQNFIQ